MRRVEIVRALLHKPQLLLLDEPTVGLDIEARADILRHVRSLVSAEGLSTLWATHLIDEVAETVEASMDAERLRRCLAGLTELQRESITLAYYGGYSYAQVAALLDTALGTIKTRIRDGMTRLRACLGVS